MAWQPPSENYGDISLEDGPRFSTETQRANGYRQSRAPDRGNRIVEDIKNGNYNCSICLEPIPAGRTAKLWSCAECHNIWHFGCAKQWSIQHRDIEPLPMFRPDSWKCPTCLKESDGAHEPRCWCGKKPQSAGIGLNGTPNSCDRACLKETSCSHGHGGTCRRQCHPGPCNQPCSPTCVIRPVRDREPGTWTKAWVRMKTRKRGLVRMIVVPAIVLAIVYGLLSILVYHHIRWWTMPYLYPGFASKHGNEEFFGLMMAGLFILLPLILFLEFSIFIPLKELLVLFFNLRDIPAARPNAQATSKAGKRFLLYVVMLVFSLGILSLPALGLAGGPNIAWYNMMKESCDGLSTRIKFDSSSLFEIKSLTAGIEPSKFYMATHLEPMFDKTKYFQYYHRLSGPLQNGVFIAIDVDTTNHIWRVQELSHNDDANEWNAIGYTGKRPKGANTIFTPVPTFIPLAQHVVMSGPIGKFNETQKHMFLPSLGLVVQNMYDLIYGCELDAFVRVFNSHAINSGEDNLHAILDELWNGKGKKDKRHQVIEMRTASFGHGKQAITMCAKERHETIDKGSAFDGLKCAGLQMELPLSRRMA